MTYVLIAVYLLQFPAFSGYVHTPGSTTHVPVQVGTFGGKEPCEAAARRLIPSLKGGTAFCVQRDIDVTKSPGVNK